jgi:hypothetical protein
MKRIAAFLLTAALVACYDKPPPCNPNTIDWPRCIDPTQPSLKGDASAPKMGASLIYPGGTVYPVSIYGSTATGRSLLTCASAAACRTALGITDVSTLESDAIAHANSVVAFTYSPHFVWHPPAAAKFSSFGSQWSALVGGTGATAGVVTGERGGATQLTTGATASSTVELIDVPNGLGIYGTSFTDDLVAAGSKWHVQWDMKITTVPDSQTMFEAGWVQPNGGALGVMVGVQGSGSTANYRLFIHGGAGVTGSVAIDTKRHRFRMWHDGGVATGTVNWTIDNVAQTALTGVTWGVAATPYFRMQNGSTAAAQTAILYDAIYQVDGVQIPPP